MKETSMIVGKNPKLVALAIALVFPTLFTACVAADEFRVGPVVKVRPVTDVITEDSDGLIEAFVSNSSLNDVTLTFDVWVSVPAGYHLYSEGWAVSASTGTVYGSLRVQPGTAKTVYLYLKADQSAVGREDFIHLSAVYYPGENKNNYQTISLTHPFRVLSASPDPYSSKPTNPEQFSTDTDTDQFPSWEWWQLTLLASTILGGIAVVVAAGKKANVTIRG